MLSNSRIADVLDQLADLLEFQGANAFRIRAYRSATRAIRNTSTSIAQVAQQHPKNLTHIDGIGKSVAEKCVELVQRGSLDQLDQLLRQIPKSVLAMLRIPGLGPKKAAAIYQQLGITTLEQLREACEAERIRTLKGFGPKSEQMILKGIGLAERAGKRIYWAVADQQVQQLRDYMAGCHAVQQLEFAGSYRRGKETVGDLDLLVVSEDSTRVMDYFGRFPDVADTIARGETKMSVRLGDGLQVDLRVVTSRSFGAALQYFTGSKEHNVILRSLAKKENLKINEYGVFRLEDQTEQVVAGQTEADVYNVLGLPVFPPELREARQEFQWAARNELPELVTASDIRGDLHMHTTATDGNGTLEEMVDAARKRGLDFVAITDHSQRLSMLDGLDPKRLLDQWSQIDQLNDQLDGDFLVLKGIECDILENGDMDLPDEVLAQADWVVASVHFGQRQSREQITSRILGALAHPFVSAIAHPTGRLINRRDAYEVDMEAVLQAASEHGKLMELNAHPARLDLNDVHCAAAKELGVPIVISTDAHSVAGLDMMRYGVLQARRGGLTASDVANTHTWAEIQQAIGGKR